MTQLNSLIIEGKLVKEPEIKHVSSGKTVCNITIANNRYIPKDDGTFDQDTTYIDCECWNKLADLTESRGRKGCSVRVVGRLKQSRWTDSSGQNRSKIAVIGEHLEFLKPPVSEVELPADPSVQAEQSVVASSDELFIPF